MEDARTLLDIFLKASCTIKLLDVHWFKHVFLLDVFTSWLDVFLLNAEHLFEFFVCHVASEVVCKHDVVVSVFYVQLFDDGVVLVPNVLAHVVL